ncbi:MAG: geranylgeranyl reductase family protein [Acidimicrobiales bacterium]
MSGDPEVRASGLPERCEVLVVGAGPSGSSTAYWLAEAGFDVVVVEKKHFPREKTCGDGLTPRAVRQLKDMGLEDALAGHHRFDGLRALAFGKVLHLPWPEHSGYGRHGYVITRFDLDALVAARAEKAGAIVVQGCEALAPLGEHAESGGPALGVVVRDLTTGQQREITAGVLVVADGANSRIGRALGAMRDRSVPLGMALRGYYASPRHDEAWIESRLDLRDPDGASIPGYGWIFPLGDGRVNVGVGVLSTEERWRGLNTSRLMEAFVKQAPESWGLSEKSALSEPTGGRLPMGLSVGPRHGPDYLMCGDASGSINPFNGEGISYGYETGRIAAAFVAQALVSGDLRELGNYENKLQENYGLYYKTASASMRFLGHPEVMRALVATGMHSRSLMEWLLRIMSNQLRDDEIAPAELAYRAIEKIALLAA